MCLGCHQAGYCSLACQQGAWWVWLTWRPMIDLASRLHSVPLITRWFIASARREGHKKACKAARKERVRQGDVVVAPPSTAATESTPGTALDSRDSPAALPLHVCDQCGTTAPDMLMCLGCHTACYCCAACQRAAWWVGSVRGAFVHSAGTLSQARSWCRFSALLREGSV